MKFEAVWTPQEKQALALASPAFELFFGGARGGGKSDFLLADFTKNLHYGSRHKGVLFRRSYPELEELISRSHELYPKIGGKWNESKRTWFFDTGASLKMRFLERPGDVTNYQGHQYTWAGFDELTNWPTEYEYTTIMGTVRSPSGVPVAVRSSGNPGSRGHAWVKARFIDPMPPYDLFYDERTHTTRMFIPAFLEDNNILRGNDPTYENRLRNMGERLFRAHRWGDWDTVEGGAFDEWRRDVHVVEPFVIPRSWFRFASLDWGYARPYSIGFYCVSPDGWVCRYNEMYGGTAKRPNEGAKKSADQVAREAWQLAAREGIEDLVADPSIWQSHGHSRSRGETTSIADSFKRVGFRLHKARNDRIGGKAQVHKMLQSRRQDGKAMLTFTTNCTHAIRTFPVLTVDPLNPEDVDTTVEDHAYDDVRYALNSRFIYRKPHEVESELREMDKKQSEYAVLDW
jgi:hypothetical protein